jgi:serine/threonine protein phosphatase PrpC
VECEPDVTRLVLQPHRDTFVVLGSDGLWDVLSDTDAVSTAAAALKVSSLGHSPAVFALGIGLVACFMRG